MKLTKKVNDVSVRIRLGQVGWKKRGIIISRRLQKMRAMFISPVIVFYGRFVTDCVQTVRDLAGISISGRLRLDGLFK